MIAALRNRAGDSLRGLWGVALAGACVLGLGCGSGNLGSLIGAGVGAEPRASRGGAASAESLSADAGPVMIAAPAGFCGDGVIQSALGEQCDGAERGGRDCASLGYAGGVLGCQVATCQFDTASCAAQDAGSPPPAMPKLDAGADAGAGGAGGAAGTAGAGGTMGPMGTCPVGFSCRAALGQAAQRQCMQWGEETPPVCFTAGAGDCAGVLPGASCTDMGIAMFCVLACSP